MPTSNIKARPKLSSAAAEAERMKHARKTAQDEWDTKQAPAVNKAPIPDAMLAAIAADTETADPELIKRIWSTARQLYAKQKEQAKLTSDLEVLAQEIRILQETTLPDMLSQAQTKELTSDTGFVLEKKDKVYASISQANSPAALAWMEKMGYGALIKCGFAVPIDKGDTKTMKLVRDLLKKAKLAFEEKSSVHPQTLLAFVRESIQKARTLPESIKYHIQPTVEIKPPKVKKTTNKFAPDSNDIEI